VVERKFAGLAPGKPDIVIRTAALAVSRNVALGRCAQSSSPKLQADPHRATDAVVGFSINLRLLVPRNTQLSTIRGTSWDTRTSGPSTAVRAGITVRHGTPPQGRVPGQSGGIPHVRTIMRFIVSVAMLTLFAVAASSVAAVSTDLGGPATVVVDGIGTLDQSSEGGVAIDITLSARPDTAARDGFDPGTLRIAGYLAALAAALVGLFVAIKASWSGRE
jgi:hypothetical protein